MKEVEGTRGIRAVKWSAGQCCVHGCTMTMVRYIGGGQWLCWLHALLHDLHT